MAGSAGRGGGRFDDPEELATTRGAAKCLAEAGEIRRVRDRGDPDGGVYWLRPHAGAPEVE